MWHSLRCPRYVSRYSLMDETTYQTSVNGIIVINWIELGEDSAQFCERSCKPSGSIIMTIYVCGIAYSCGRDIRCVTE